MTAPATTICLDTIDAALSAATPGLDADGQRLAAAVLRLLSAGAPVPHRGRGRRRTAARVAGRAAAAVLARGVLGRP